MEHIRAKDTVHGNNCTKSPKGPVMMRVMGKNMPEMASVANDIGTNNALVL